MRRAEELGGRVVRAERLRKGVLGRRWYEVTVDVPDRSGDLLSYTAARWRREASSAEKAPVERQPAGIADLLAAAEAAERAETAAGRAARRSRASSDKASRGR